MSQDLSELPVFHFKDFLKILFDANREITPIQRIASKDHYKYLLDYLGKDRGIHAKFILFEKEYISKDYLTDFSSYYSLCFEKYDKTTVRLHYFSYDENPELSEEESLNDFKGLLRKFIIEGSTNKDIHKKIQYNYLGHTVITPIPNTFIGYSLLNHYNCKEKVFPYDIKRKFWGIKDYKIHLYGNELSVSTLAFQEQDGNVASCATIAMWCMLQRAAEDYYVILRSPSEITKDSGLTTNKGHRIFPNKGIFVRDICQAITKNGLVTEVRYYEDLKDTETSNNYIKKIINAYSQIGIPIILGLKVPVGDYIAGHAIAICGHKEEPRRNEKLLKSLWNCLFKEEKSITFLSERICKFYAHDDQFGPFSRMTFRGKDKLRTLWYKKSNSNTFCKPVAIVISVFPKIRISYDDIERIVVGLNKLFRDILDEEFKSTLIWDIKLYKSEDFKRKFQSDDEYLDNSSESDRLFIEWFLTLPMPKYIWVVTMIVNEKKITQFIFDSTGLLDSMLLLQILSFSPVLQEKMIAYFDNLYDQMKHEKNNLQGMLTIDHIHKISEKLRSFNWKGDQK